MVKAAPSCVSIKAGWDCAMAQSSRDRALRMALFSAAGILARQTEGLNAPKRAPPHISE
jgi:hypothetical protein